MEDLKGERERRLEAQPHAERQEQEQWRLQQEVQRLREELEQGRRKRSEIQQLVEQLEREYEHHELLYRPRLAQAVKCTETKRRWKEALEDGTLERCAEQLIECGCYGHEYLQRISV
jgi:hypothetical protein